MTASSSKRERLPETPAEVGEHTQSKLIKVLAVEGLRNVFDPRKHLMERLTATFATDKLMTASSSKRERLPSPETPAEVGEHTQSKLIKVLAVEGLRNVFDPRKHLMERNNLSLQTNQAHINDLLELAEALVSTTAPDFSALTRFAHQHHLLDSVNILQLIGAAHPEYDTDVNSFDPEYNGLPIRQIITERGICYALNAPLASTLQVTNLTGSSEKTVNQKSATCTYTKNQCYMKIDTYESTISFIIHSPTELVTSDTPFTMMGTSDEVVVSYEVQETVASNRLRDLTVKQRNCIFNDERHHGLKFYSYNLCVMRCRAAKALELCHCKPHFYPFVDGPTCTVAGLLCLAEQPSGRWYDEKLSCRCLKPCTEIVYLLVGTTQNQWRAEGGIPFKQRTSVRWEILQPKTRLLRDVLFSFEDLLVSFGGGFALFIGKNVFTLAELFDFMLHEVMDKIHRWFQTRA
ncbi:pickpocket [Culex quinquefasciatus]|uniref:Pickpocket n=1 Tax=Culex quinquefasciatus TaxID=7176 RepID=B0WAK2_CULQU|nr:pickpocket [Culex quinquefasciatus]|eukprot:XP_001845736.1 pickpocket [Culex quinquefasciatus]